MIASRETSERHAPERIGLNTRIKLTIYNTAWHGSWSFLNNHSLESAHPLREPLFCSKLISSMRIRDTRA